VLILALRIIAADDLALIAAVACDADLNDAVARLGQPITENLRCLIVAGARARRRCSPAASSASNASAAAVVGRSNRKSQACVSPAAAGRAPLRCSADLLALGDGDPRLAASLARCSARAAACISCSTDRSALGQMLATPILTLTNFWRNARGW
jgi:hypothetical protein